MKKIVSFLIAMLCMTATLPAQEKKAFTLDDVIPGGSNYFNLTPKNLPGLQWWEDVCVRVDVEDIKRLNNRTGQEKSVVVTLKEVNEALQNGEKPYQLTLPIKPLHTLQGATLPWGNRNIVMFFGKVGNEEKSEDYVFFYDFVQKKLANMFRIQEEQATNFDFCKENGYLAYTAGDHLYIANQGDYSIAVSPHITGEKEVANDIVYGQSVHRNEFGIMKGTFWSPKGS